jgi:hypothetical protein
MANLKIEPEHEKVCVLTHGFDGRSSRAILMKEIIREWTIYQHSHTAILSIGLIPSFDWRPVKTK